MTNLEFAYMAEKNESSLDGPDVSSLRYFTKCIWGVLAIVLSLSLAGCPTPPEPPPPEPGGPFSKPYIRGEIVVSISDHEQDERTRVTEISVPDVRVTLRDDATNGEVASVHTDLSGRYSFAQVQPGAYRICWEKEGFVPACRDTSLQMNELPFRVEPLAMQVDPAYRAIIYGQVRLRSGQLRILEPLADINHFATVRLTRLDGSLIAYTFLNNFGQYVLPLASSADHVRVEAVAQNLVEPRTLVAELLQQKRTHHVDITLRNDAPRLEVVARLAGQRVRTAPPGATVRLEAAAVDLDGDLVQMRWYLPPASGTLNQLEGPAVDWRLPEASGLYTVYLFANDGRGGYTRVATLLHVTTEGVTFSGRVRATDAPFVADAEVDVNGVRTTTNAAGYFWMKVPDSSEYIVNITKPGYGLVSRVYLDPMTGGRWTLTRGSTFTADPTAPIDLTDRREHQRCDGPFSTRINWEEYTEQARPRIVGAHGRIQRVDDRRPRDTLLPPSRQCGPGFRVEIPANALVDSDGNPPPGLVDITINTVDLRAPDDMPGDFGALDEDGNPRFMQSFGAGSITITAGGIEYNLQEGSEARITIPIDPDQLAAPGPEPDRIPLLRYDRTEGMWVTIGEMERVNNTYQAMVDGFSEFNADLVFTNPACVQIYSPQSSPDFTGLPASYRLEITVPQSDAAPRVFDTVIDNSVPYHTVYRLPANTNIVLVPYSEATNTPYGTFIVNTGGPQVPASPFRPAYPYNACQATVVLYDVVAPEVGTDAFLHGLYSFAATNLDELSDTGLADAIEQSTIDYYNQVDPRELRRTLEDFRNRNNFDGSEEIRAVYANSADLGFGRDMRCVRNPATDGNDDDVACYVTNYGNETTSDEADFQLAVEQDGAFASVAMEYSRIENDPGDPDEYTDPDRVVKFFVYGADGSLLNSANLDNRGARPIPQLCLVCHGGDTGGTTVPAGFPDRDSVKLGAVFVPFDLPSFTIVDGIDSAFDKAAQQAAFKQLNEEIVNATQPGEAIEAIVDAMYNNGVSPVQIEDFVISGWDANAAQQEAYREVVAKSCRMCHASQPQTNPLGLDIRFHEADDFIALGSLVPFRVCTQRVMPHALRTYNRFWQSIGPHQPAQLQAFGETQVPVGYGTVCGAPLVAAPPTDAGFADVSEYFAVTCAGCHAGPKAVVSQAEACGPDPFPIMAPLLDLTPANAYAGIVGVPAVQPTSIMNLVTPGNPAQSYLFHKMAGTHLAVGGCGVQMPFGVAPTQEELDLIQQWIEDGALP
jgi:hypothetical protein